MCKKIMKKMLEVLEEGRNLMCKNMACRILVIFIILTAPIVVRISSYQYSVKHKDFLEVLLDAANRSNTPDLSLTNLEVQRVRDFIENTEPSHGFGTYFLEDDSSDDIWDLGNGYVFYTTYKRSAYLVSDKAQFKVMSNIDYIPKEIPNDIGDVFPVAWQEASYVSVSSYGSNNKFFLCHLGEITEYDFEILNDKKIYFTYQDVWEETVYLRSGSILGYFDTNTTEFIQLCTNDSGVDYQLFGYAMYYINTDGHLAEINLITKEITVISDVTVYEIHGSDSVRATTFDGELVLVDWFINSDGERTYYN